MKKILKIISALLALIVIVVIIFVATYQPKKYTDFGVYEDLASWATTLFEQDMQPRPVSKYFNNFNVDLGFPFTKVFGASRLGVYLKSFENEQISAATVSMFELPPGTGYYSVFTLNLVPRYGYRAPVLHVDFMKPQAGVSGMFILDFFNVAPDAISCDTFLGADIATVKEALALVEQYQRTEEQGRGKMSRHLDPYKSAYRMELQEPKTDDAQVRKAYYTAVDTALRMVVPVYMKRIAMLQQDPGFVAVQEQGMNTMANELFTKDFAVKNGKKIFKQHFAKYWAEAFWNVNMPAEPK